MPIHMQYITPTNHPPLKFRQLIIWRWCATLSAYFMLSLAYSFVSMAFQINFWDTNSVTSHSQVTIQSEGNPVAFGSATFVVYWMLNFCGMIALGLACENMAMIVGMPWMGLFLIFWVITNVSTAFYDIEIAPAFYRWGYAWPLHSSKFSSLPLTFAASGLCLVGANLTHSCRRKSHDSFRSPLAPWFGLWYSHRMGSGQYALFPFLLLVHEVEDAEGCSRVLAFGLKTGTWHPGEAQKIILVTQSALLANHYSNLIPIYHVILSVSTASCVSSRGPEGINNVL